MYDTNSCTDFLQISDENTVTGNRLHRAANRRNEERNKSSHRKPKDPDHKVWGLLLFWQ